MITLFFQNKEFFLKNLPPPCQKDLKCYQKKFLSEQLQTYWPWTYVLIKRYLQEKINDRIQDQCLGIFEAQDLPFLSLNLRSYQQQALDAWLFQKARGIVSLPTGAGKTRLALAAIQKLKLKTLILVPTLELLKQWEKELKNWFQKPIGVIGGGRQEYHPITVSTYQSGSKKGLEHYFAFHIYDEVHHLPAEQFSLIARNSLSPYRLGLTATLNQEEEKFSILRTYCGEVCFQKTVEDLAGRSLAPYEHKIIDVELIDIEKKVYEIHRKKFLKLFQRIPFQKDWQKFIQACSRLPGGKKGLTSQRIQKKVSFLAEKKWETIQNLLDQHPNRKILIFTNDNESAYRIGERLLLPVITYRTPKKEREALLQGFREGSFTILVTSRVLNEGVDVPDAEIAIIFSGNASERELIQRLGRILRYRNQKEACLYEIVTAKTSEVSVSLRRQKGLL